MDREGARSLGSVVMVMGAMEKGWDYRIGRYGHAPGKPIAAWDYGRFLQVLPLSSLSESLDMRKRGYHSPPPPPGRYGMSGVHMMYLILVRAASRIIPKPISSL